MSSKINLTASQTGFVYAFIALFFMVIYGLVQDRLGVKKLLLWIQSVVILGCGPFFIYINDGYKLYGYLGSLQVFLEAGMMGLAPFLVNRLGAKYSLVLAAFLSALRILLSGYFTSIILISGMKLFHAFEISIILVSVFKYISLNFDRRLSASIFLIGFQIAGSVGVISLSSFIGIIYDK